MQNFVYIFLQSDTKYDYQRGGVPNMENKNNNQNKNNNNNKNNKNNNRKNNEKNSNECE